MGRQDSPRDGQGDTQCPRIDPGRRHNFGEQAQKYGILPGDSVKIRLFKKPRTPMLNVVARAVGFFTFFPTSSQDSDFIVNRDFMTRNVGNDIMDYYLVKTKPEP